MDKLFTGVTLHGMPVRIELQWPFHRSEGGSDWYVLHGTLRLNDGGPLHADLALNLAQTVREALPSLDGDLAFWVAVNTARKTLDDKDLELLNANLREINQDQARRIITLTTDNYRLTERASL